MKLLATELPISTFPGRIFRSRLQIAESCGEIVCYKNAFSARDCNRTLQERKQQSWRSYGRGALLG